MTHEATASITAPAHSHGERLVKVAVVFVVAVVFSLFSLSDNRITGSIIFFGADGTVESEREGEREREREKEKGRVGAEKKGFSAFMDRYRNEDKHFGE